MKNVNNSSRHHYLPVFYLNGFTKNHNKIKIYNVVKKKFIRGGKDFSPKSYFFQEDVNTITIDDKESDFLETNHYKKIDGKVSKIINTIKLANGSENYNITDYEIVVLEHFVNLMYWRFPLRGEDLNKIMSNPKILIEYNLLPSSMIGNEIDFNENPDILKVLQYYLPLNSINKSNGINKPIAITSTDCNYPYLCSDNPVIFENDVCPFTFKNDYLFPISGSRIMVKSNKGLELPEKIKFWVDMIIFKQAVKYVTCTDEWYLESLDKDFEKNFSSVNDLKELLFSKLS